MYWYATEDGGSVRIVYNLSEYWIIFGEGNLQIEVDKKLEGKFNFKSNGVSSRPTPEDKLKQYATLFYQKPRNTSKRPMESCSAMPLLPKSFG